MAWLSEYLQQHDTTMIVVSHDYDFLSDVATDIIYFNNGTLGYYRSCRLSVSSAPRPFFCHPHASPRRRGTLPPV